MLQEQLQLADTEKAPENESTILYVETESIDKQSKEDKKWWHLWK
jgi:hypothetical protein